MLAGEARTFPFLGRLILSSAFVCSTDLETAITAGMESK